MNLRHLIFCKPNRRNGFTLVELMVALMITSIVLAAVATLAPLLMGFALTFFVAQIWRLIAGVLL